MRPGLFLWGTSDKICNRMALIGKIRENTIFVLIFIGLGIGLFIMMDIMTSQSQGMGAGGGLKMGEVGEMEINQQEFERIVSTVYSGGDAYANRENLWNFYVTEAMLKQEAKAMGLGVSSTELRDLEFGANPSRVIQRNFGDPNTGQLNRQLLSNIQQYIDNGNIEEGITSGQLNQNFRAIWGYQRREVIAQRLQEKMDALVGKAAYAPSWLAQNRADAGIQNISAAIVKVPFDAITENVSVSDEDIQNYLEENAAAYTNDEERRVVSYVSFDVAPNAADSAAIRTTLMDVMSTWPAENQTEDSLYALANNGTFVDVAYSRNAISPVIVDQVFDVMEVGDIYGPYVEGSAMKLAKLVDREMLADSADTRHILVNAATPAEFDEANALVDSLMQVIETQGRGRFDDLAQEFSEDPGSKSNGGLYEAVTPGQFVKPYDDIIFRTGNLRQLYKVRSQFGVHLVEVLSRTASTSPRVKVAYVVEDIIPSSDTEDSALERAQQFLADHSTLEALREGVANEADLSLSQAAPITVHAYAMPELGDNSAEIQDIACWAFSEDEGDVSGRVYTFTDPRLFYENKHVIVAVSEVIPAGLPSVASVREEMTVVVGNQMKAEQAGAAVAGQDLTAIAAKYGVLVDTVANINLTMASLTNGIGREPKVIGAAFNTQAQNVSAPVVGSTGLFFVKPLSVPATGNSGSLPGARQQQQAIDRGQLSLQLTDALRQGLEIDDRRAELNCR